MLNVVVGGARHRRRRRRRMREKRSTFVSHAQMMAVFSFLSLLLAPPLYNPEAVEKNHTESVCGEHKIESISSLSHSRVSATRKAHVLRCWVPSVKELYRFCESSEWKYLSCVVQSHFSFFSMDAKATRSFLLFDDKEQWKKWKIN